jgi:hypothetical protein
MLPSIERSRENTFLLRMYSSALAILPFGLGYLRRQCYQLCYILAPEDDKPAPGASIHRSYVLSIELVWVRVVPAAVLPQKQPAGWPLSFPLPSPLLAEGSAVSAAYA